MFDVKHRKQSENIIIFFYSFIQFIASLETNTELVSSSFKQVFAEYIFFVPLFILFI